MKKLLVVSIIITSISVVNFYHKVYQASFATYTSAAQNQVGLPTQIIIPKLGITAPIEYVGEDAEGRMDVPKEWTNTAWYQLGVKPGEKGRAVIAGHFDSPTGPAIFVNLNQLTPGDRVEIRDQQTKTRTFVVVRIESYPDQDFPIERVFGPSEQVELNLITCGGNFDESSNSYSHRLVVYTKLAYD